MAYNRAGIFMDYSIRVDDIEVLICSPRIEDKFDRDEDVGVGKWRAPRTMVMIDLLLRGSVKR